jgi:hypothetical protein
VFIEALWVIPSKFEVLIALHPHIKWIVRIHSKIPFLANEGIAIDWLKDYYAIAKKHPKKLFLSANSIDVVESLNECLDMNVLYHPNIYDPPEYSIDDVEEKCGKYIDIGCFGALRPMKNQLHQAMVAIAFGNQIGKIVRFHINSNRMEQRGEAVLKNIENCFEGTKHILVKHNWIQHGDFIKLVRTMDLGLQVSMSESFNIVCADFVANNIPIVGSKDIKWLSFIYKANANDFDEMLLKLYIAYYGKYVNLQSLNTFRLNRYNAESIKQWLDSILFLI